MSPSLTGNGNASVTSSVVPTSSPSSCPVTKLGAHSAQCLRILRRTWPSIWTVLSGPSDVAEPAAAANESGAAAVGAVVMSAFCFFRRWVPVDWIDGAARELRRRNACAFSPLFGAMGSQRKKSEEKIEQTILPTILPRLGDFFTRSSREEEKRERGGACFFFLPLLLLFLFSCSQPCPLRRGRRRRSPSPSLGEEENSGHRRRRLSRRVHLAAAASTKKRRNVDRPSFAFVRRSSHPFRSFSLPLPISLQPPFQLAQEVSPWTQDRLGLVR